MPVYVPEADRVRYSMRVLTVQLIRKANIMKTQHVLWTLSTLIILTFCFGSLANAQLQPPYFHDDFEDGSVTDDDPVSWVLTPPFDKGRLKSSMAIFNDPI